MNEKHILQRPVFVLAAGWRSGSTLLQRLLCSHPEIHIWGENHGICADLERACGRLMKLQPMSRCQTADFDRLQTRGWIALMNPPAAEFSAGLQVLLDTFFGAPGREVRLPGSAS